MWWYLYLRGSKHQKFRRKKPELLANITSYYLLQIMKLKGKEKEREVTPRSKSLSLVKSCIILR